jgi:hypothetical protein
MYGQSTLLPSSVGVAITYSGYNHGTEAVQEPLKCMDWAVNVGVRSVYAQNLCKHHGGMYNKNYSLYQCHVGP